MPSAGTASAMRPATPTTSATAAPAVWPPSTARVARTASAATNVYGANAFRGSQASVRTSSPCRATRTAASAHSTANATAATTNRTADSARIPSRNAADDSDPVPMTMAG